MGSHRERVEALVAEAKALIEEISSDGRQAVAGAEAEADRNVRCHGELRDERDALVAEAAALEDELDAMPVLHSKAVLEDDVDEELRLKDRFRDAKDRRAEISARLPEVEAELKALSPRGGHDNEVMIEQYAAVNRAASGPLASLRRLGSEISNLAEKGAGHFEQVLTDRQGESWSWRNDLSWTDEARERLRRSGNIPGEDRTRTVRADPARLERRGSEAG
jgi:chromosome segregation ATPase